MLGSTFLSLLKISAATSIVIFVLWMLSPYLNKTYSSAWKYWIWLILAFRLMIPFSLSLPQAPVEFKVPEAAFTHPVTIWEAPSAEPKPGPNAEGPKPAVQPSESAVPTDTGIHSPTAIEILMFIWGLGAIAFLSYQFTGYILFKRQALRWSSPVRSEEANRLFKSVKSDIHQNIVFLVSKAIESPMMIGFFRPVLLLPNEEYNSADLTFILRHELTHFKRRDIWYKLLLAFVNAVHWFNPFIWLMRRDACADLELSCDDEVIKGISFDQRRAYSETILSAIKQQKTRRTSLSTYFLGGQKTLKSRFLNILNTKTRKNGVMLLVAVLLAVAILGGLVACTSKTEGSSESSVSSGAYQKSGLVVPLPDSFNGKVETTPEDKLPEDVVMEAYHTASRQQNSNIGFLFRIVRKTDAQWEDYWVPKSRIGGVRPFARDNTYVYTVETATDVQAGEGLYDEYSSLEQQIDSSVLPGIIAKNNLIPYDFNIIESYINLFVHSGANGKSWQSPEEAEPYQYLSFFSYAAPQNSIRLDDYYTEDRGVAEYAIPRAVIEGLIMNHFGVSAEYLRRMPQYDAGAQVYRSQFNNSGPDPIATPLSYTANGNKLIIVYLLEWSDPAFEGGACRLELTTDSSGGFKYTSFDAAGQFTSADGAKLRGEYFDFAIKNRLDYMPFFNEGNAPTESKEYLYYAFAVNLDNWGDDKGTMTREYVDKVIHSYFIVGEIKHVPLPRGWNYDGKTYTAVPMGINEKPIYALSKLVSSIENGHTVYTATLGCYNENSGFIPSDDEMEKIRADIASGDLTGLMLIQNEKIRYYTDELTGQPVFLAHTLEQISLPGVSKAKPDPVYDPASFLSDEEMVTADGVRLNMTYEEVLAIIGKPDEAYENAPDVKSLIQGAYHYGFYQINKSFPKDYPLPHDGKYYLLNMSVEGDCADPLPRGIRIGDDIQDVFDKFPTETRELKKWAHQTVYGKQEIGQPRAFLEFTTVLGTYRICATTTKQTLNVHFDKQNKVKSVDLIVE